MRNRLMFKAFVFILCFSFITSFLPFQGVKSIKTNTFQSYNGRTIYVGGNGPGNYSKIQDAIDNATNNDTVFVYHDSSPYFENIFINKSIALKGENKTTTIINAEGVGGNAVTITVDYVTFSGFSVLNWGYNISSQIGIRILANNCSIIGNILSCTHVWYGYNALLLLHSKDNIIMDNFISHCHLGITLEFSSQNFISKNLIMDCLADAGILLRSSNENNISENIIVNSTYGIDAGDSNSNIIISNEISYNVDGFSLSHCLKNVITKNNFRKNIEYDAYNIFSFQPFWRNTWNANYWHKPRLLPKVIFGYLEYHKNRLIMIPWVNVDWHPVTKPYNISLSI